MGCLFAMSAGLFPRLALFMLWVARPGQVDADLGVMDLPVPRHHLPAVYETDTSSSTAGGGWSGSTGPGSAWRLPSDPRAHGATTYS